MAESVPGAVLKQLTKSLEAVEWQLANEPVPRDALREFKSAVDHIRLSTWALLDAGEDVPGSAGAQSTIALFRLVRATELVNHIRADLEAGLIPVDSRDLIPFREAVSDLAELVNHYVGNAT